MITALAGRRIDEENANYQRFPLRCVSSVKQSLQHTFSKNGVTHLVSSGACGADLLGQLVAQEMKIERTIIIPFSVEEFKTMSVTDRPGDWGNLYDQLIHESKNLIQLNYKSGNSDAYLKTNFEILNECRKLSTQQSLKSMMAAIVVWDKKVKPLSDTTHDFKTEAEKQKLRIIEIQTLT